MADPLTELYRRYSAATSLPTCATCKQSLPPESFGVDRSKKDGLTRQCRDCRNAERRCRYANGYGAIVRKRFAEQYATDPEFRRKRQEYALRAFEKALEK